MDRQREIQYITQFVDEHRESYASLAVCRRALDQGLARVDSDVVSRLQQYLATAPDEEIEAYSSIVR